MQQSDETRRTGRSAPTEHPQPAANGTSAAKHGGPRAKSALAIGAVAFGALALGAVAIGALAIGRLSVRSARIRRLEIDELVVRKNR